VYLAYKFEPITATEIVLINIHDVCDYDKRRCNRRGDRCNNETGDDIGM